MSTKVTVTGNLGQEPELRYTPQNKAVLELSVNGTRSQKDKTTGQWSDDGAPLWVAATFWEDEAQRLAEALHKGDQVTVSGDLVLEEYQKRDGTPGQKHVLRFPRFLGVIPRQRRSGVQEAHRGAYSQQPPNGSPSDPWAAQGASYNEQPPF